jgi:outer membrane protein assembly factor BamB
MTALENVVFLGVHGAVLALDRATGEELWRVTLKGGDFVNMTLDRDQLFASTKGEVFCLDAMTGQTRWHSKLPGMGLGLISIVTAASPATNIGPAAETRKRDEQSSAAVTASIVAST